MTPENVQFIEGLAHFNDFGAATQIEELDGVSYYINEFWTSR